MTSPVSITLRVNDTAHAVTVPPDMPLLWVLREVLQLEGTRYGCGMALCGSCTVLLDGSPSRACVLPAAQMSARNVVTIEGVLTSSLAPIARAVQQAWTDGNVAQCGYCQSGQVLTAIALLRDTPDPSDTDIDRAFDGMLCRCGTAPRVRAAVHRAATLLRSPGSVGNTADATSSSTTSP